MSAPVVTLTPYDWLRAHMATTAVGFRNARAGDQLAMLLSAAHHGPGKSEDEALTARLHACADRLAEMRESAIRDRVYDLIAQLAETVDALEREIG